MPSSSYRFSVLSRSARKPLFSPSHSSTRVPARLYHRISAGESRPANDPICAYSLKCQRPYMRLWQWFLSGDLGPSRSSSKAPFRCRTSRYNVVGTRGTRISVHFPIGVTNPLLGPSQESGGRDIRRSLKGVFSGKKEAGNVLGV
eukprot:1195959-Rhodomonas_salina.2